MNGSNRLRVLVLGYGEMGHAFESLLATRHALRIWQRRPPGGQVPIDLEHVVPQSDIVVFCLPATAHAAVAARVAPYLSRERQACCLTIAKGLGDDGRLPAEILATAAGATRTAVLYGPMIAEEIRAGRAAFAQCGAADAALAVRVAALFTDTALFVETTTDVPGLSWSAILKNVYALAFGMADELALGDNVRGLLSVAAVHELSRIVPALGGTAVTPYWLAGLGDLITTATSAGSYHHDLGRRLARGERDLAGEGLHTLAVLHAHPRFDSARLPLFRLIETSVRDPRDLRARLTAWLRAPFNPA